MRRGVGYDIRTKKGGSKKRIVFASSAMQENMHRKMVGKSRSMTKAWPCEA